MHRLGLSASLIFSLALANCGDNSPAPPTTDITTEHCNYVPMVATANSGGTVQSGPLTAGAAERVLDVPVGTALGGYTARAGFIGAAGNVDTRKIPLSGSFNPSIGVRNAPRVKALALTAGGETVVIIKVDMIFTYEGMLFDVESKLGPQFAGKVILSSSHSHAAWAQYSGHAPLKLGSGELRDIVYKRFVDGIVATAQAALAARVPAKLGIAQDNNFDPQDQITRDRRSDNDTLPGGKGKDTHLSMIVVDNLQGQTLAAVPIFGMHGTLGGESNPLASSDSIGAVEQSLQGIVSPGAVVMHLQSAGGDVSPVGQGSIDCNVKPGKASDPCFDFTTEEGLARAPTTQTLMGSAYMNAKTAMKESIALEMLSRSIELGPSAKTFTIRKGALSYAEFDTKRVPDGKVYDGAGAIISPIDEFNAPVGAALCQNDTPMFPAAAIDGTEGIATYGSCLRLDVAGGILQSIFNINFGVDETHPVCETTRTTISTLRIGEFVIGTLPGEVTNLLANYVRTNAPTGDKTIIVGYAQGHVGYMLRPEDWLLGGYEPSVTFWGPLEAEYIAEQLLKLLPLAQTDTREDGTQAGTTRLQARTAVDTLIIDKPAPMTGTVPSTVSAEIWSRVGPLANAQPSPQIRRVSGVATFVWNGDDPLNKTPRVSLQKQNGTGFETIKRVSGQSVNDNEVILSYTPQPLRRSNGQAQTHVWVAEWQVVPWFGITDATLNGMKGRAGVPLGNYRFFVEGDGWTLASSPFEVVPENLLVTASKVGSNLRLFASIAAPKGWRLLDAAMPSNKPVPLRTQLLNVVQRNAAGIISNIDMTTSAAGVVDIAAAAGATTVIITDPFGNAATIAAPL
jgi:neutral ceramidase